MAEIMKVFREEVPAMRFIGKKYHDYSGWGEWFANGWFETIENSMGGTDRILGIWENGGAYVGLECRKNGDLQEYWIGMFAPENTAVPEGFAHIHSEVKPWDLLGLRKGRGGARRCGELPGIHPQCRHGNRG